MHGIRNFDSRIKWNVKHNLYPSCGGSIRFYRTNIPQVLFIVVRRLWSKNKSALLLLGKRLLQSQWWMHYRFKEIPAASQRQCALLWSNFAICMCLVWSNGSASTATESVLYFMSWLMISVLFSCWSQCTRPDDHGAPL